VPGARRARSFFLLELSALSALPALSSLAPDPDPDPGPIAASGSGSALASIMAMSGMAMLRVDQGRAAHPKLGAWFFGRRTRAGEARVTWVIREGARHD
jgi:hypothetical protein